MLAALAAFGPWGAAVSIVLLVAWLVYTGRLVPRRTYDDAKVQADARVREIAAMASVWKQAYQTSEAARVEERSLIHDYASGIRTIITMLETRRDECP